MDGDAVVLRREVSSVLGASKLPGKISLLFPDQCCIHWSFLHNFRLLAVFYINLGLGKFSLVVAVYIGNHPFSVLNESGTTGNAHPITRFL